MKLNRLLAQAATMTAIFAVASATFAAGPSKSTAYYSKNTSSSSKIMAAKKLKSCDHLTDINVYDRGRDPFVVSLPAHPEFGQQPVYPGQVLPIWNDYYSVPVEVLITDFNGYPVFDGVVNPHANISVFCLYGSNCVYVS